MYCNPACAKAQRFVPGNPARPEGSLYLHSFMFSRNVKSLQCTILASAIMNKNLYVSFVYKIVGNFELWETLKNIYCKCRLLSDARIDIMLEKQIVEC